MNSKVPLVSVLMTAYNRESFIPIAIESVLDSTFKDFELVIVDDCSTDNTYMVMKKYEQLDNRIRIFRNEKNMGDYPNRNIAASYAKGKYLKYVDSDDYLYPFGLEIMVEGMEKFPEAAMGISAPRQNLQKPFPFVLDCKEAYEYQFFGPGLFRVGPLSVIFRREHFLSVGGFMPNRMVSDNHMWFKLSLLFPVVVVSDGLVWARTHDQQELTDSEKYLREYESIKWNYLKDPLCKLSLDQLKAIKKERIKKYLQFTLSGIKKMKCSQVKGYLECLYDIIRLDVSKSKSETNS